MSIDTPGLLKQVTCPKLTQYDIRRSTTSTNARATGGLSPDSNVRIRIAASAARPGVPDRVVVASLVDDVSNRLQVVLGFAQILHELPEAERLEAVSAIEQECAELRATLRSLTGWTRDEGGQGPWQDGAEEAAEVALGAPIDGGGC